MPKRLAILKIFLMIRCSLERRLNLISDVEREKSSDILYTKSRGPTPTHSTAEIRGRKWNDVEWKQEDAPSERGNEEKVRSYRTSM